MKLPNNISNFKFQISNYLPLILIFLIGATLRFYKLDWGEGYFFHPDERNIASLATSVSLPIDQQFFTKGTFAYGSLIPYLVFGINYLLRPFLPALLFHDNFAFNILLLRIISALFSALTITIAYLAGNKLCGKKIGLLSACLIAFSPGLIQAAHFGTFESILTFFYLLAFFFSLRLAKDHYLGNFFPALLFIAMATAIKINSLVLLPLLILILFISGGIKNKLGSKLLISLTGILIFLLLVPLLSPYYLTPGFKNMLLYEQQIVSGALDAFYTRQFFGARPVIFPLFQILPFLVNPLVVLLLPPLLFFYFLNLVRKLVREKILPGELPELMLLGFVAALFLPSAFLFA
ncbi:phospholipid carrier-dependent glycosyltransferase, partial [Candidatus Shapirobacteria bacterium]|nr:phospholipid carrier-dependent glycosyltransferase [Candidatus Shapirobacteria bacterium]